MAAAAFTLSAVGVGPAHASATYVIDSVESCQEFLNAMGATIGTAAPGSCVVSSEGSEVHLPAGDSVYVAVGWELFVNAVVFFNHGVIVNDGTFRATDDVVNNVEESWFVNRGTVRIQRGSAFNIFDDARVVNKGQILIECEASDGTGTVIGNPPVLLGCDAAPAVVRTWPVAGASHVRRHANIFVTFSESVRPESRWYRLWCARSGRHRGAVSQITPATFRVDPYRSFARGEVCVFTVVGSRVADQDDIDPPDTMVGNYRTTFRTAG